MKDDEFKLILHIKNLCFLVMDITKIFPNKEKALKDNFISECFKLLENTYSANIININDNRRRLVQEKILVNIYMIDFYLSVSYHYGFISSSNFKKVTNLLSEVSKTAKGWMKYGKS